MDNSRLYSSIGCLTLLTCCIFFSCVVNIHTDLSQYWGLGVLNLIVIVVLCFNLISRAVYLWYEDTTDDSCKNMYMGISKTIFLLNFILILVACTLSIVHSNITSTLNNIMLFFVVLPLNISYGIYILYHKCKSQDLNRESYIYSSQVTDGLSENGQIYVSEARDQRDYV